MSNFFLKYLNLSDIFSALAWLIFFIILITFQSYKFESRHTARIYRQNFYFKILFALIFAVYYLQFVQGGDTTAYWDTAKVIQNVIIEDPIMGLENLFSPSSGDNYNRFFDNITGFPPGWIYRDPQSYFVAKIAAVLGFFSFKSYFATTFIFAYLFTRANWKIYEVASDTKLFNSKWLPIAILFIPSVSFWCSGITKDTIIIISFFNIFYHFYFILLKDETKSIKRWALILFYSFLIYHTRSFLLITVIIPIFAAIVKRYYGKFNPAPIFRMPLNILILSLIIGLTVAFMSSTQGSNLIMNNSAMQEALVIQNDFTNNKTYGDNRYSLGTVDNSPFGILKAMPLSIITGVFEPFPWNGLSISLILNALESALLLFLTFQLILTGKFKQWSSTISKHEVLVFCLVFVILTAFIAGFTAIIYGVLVRFRAPLLPFWCALLVLNLSKKRKDQKSIELAGAENKKFDPNAA